jgi:tripartite-type tricarboxylate transporter receptor subunit TctC
VGTFGPYAVLAKSRWQAAPEIPTADEAGLPGLYISNWSGLWAPPGIPRAGPMILALRILYFEDLSHILSPSR